MGLGENGEQNEMRDVSMLGTTASVPNITVDRVDKSITGEQLKDEKLAKQLFIKIGYGMGEGGLYAISAILGFFQQTFLLEVAQISAGYAGIILLLGECFDAIADPVIGKLSDQTKTRWGRRRPWLFLGSFPLCFFFWLSFLVPDFFHSEAYLIIYYLIALLFLKFFYGAVGVPYTALTPEISLDYDQRTSLTMWRMIIGMSASVLAVFTLSELLVLLKRTEANGEENLEFAYAVSITVVSIPACICILVTVFTVKEILNPNLTIKPARSFLELLKETWNALACREFVTVAVSYATAWIAINFMQNNLYLWNKYILQEEDKFSILTLLIQGFSVLSLFVWSFCSKKIGKKNTALIGGVIFVPACVAFGLIPSHAFVLACFLCAMGGIGVGNMLLMPWSMLPDVMELDEIRCGYRREGIFYSWFVFFQKVGLGLSVGVSSLILGYVGYVPPDDQESETNTQPESVMLTLRLFMSAVPGVLFIICLIAIWLNPVTRASHAAATAEVLARRAQLAESEIVTEN